MSPLDQEAVTRVVTNMAKTLAAYERTLLPQEALFDRYVNSLGDDGKVRPGPVIMDATLSGDEIAGLRLFVGSGHCINCHNGPLFTNSELHNTAVPARSGLPLDHGRRRGVALVRASQFSCLGPYSDAAPEACGEIRFLKMSGATIDGSFRTPTLCNNELAPLNLSDQELAQLEAFLKTLAGPIPGPN